MLDEMRHAELVGPRRLVRRVPSTGAPAYSLCTLVTNWDEYAGCVASYRGHGFGPSDCELLTIDNAHGNIADAYVGLNEFLQSAQGEYVVLTHQDVLLLEDGRARLDACLAELDRVDAQWAVCGNAGRTSDGWPAVCISHPFRDNDIVGGPFPARVVSLDENFIVVRRVANLALSSDLSGFHFYGADLCTIADILGWNAYVIGFHLRHNSGGTLSRDFLAGRTAIQAKYARAFRPRWVHVITHFAFYASGRWPEVLLARGMRAVGMQLRLWPREYDFDNPKKRARRDRRARARAERAKL